MAIVRITMTATARAKKRGMSRLMMLLAGERIGGEVETGDASASSLSGVSVRRGARVGVSRGKGVAEGVKVRKAGEVTVGLARGVGVGVAVAVGLGV